MTVFYVSEAQLETLVEKTEEKIRAAFRENDDIEKRMDEADAALEDCLSREAPAVMIIEQKLETLNDEQAGYSNFFRYGHETRRMLNDGWHVKHIHDDLLSRTAWILYERILRVEEKPQ